jgi:hypothetical protein
LLLKIPFGSLWRVGCNERRMEAKTAVRKLLQSSKEELMVTEMKALN